MNPNILAVYCLYCSNALRWNVWFDALALCLATLEHCRISSHAGAVGTMGFVGLGWGTNPNKQRDNTELSNTNQLDWSVYCWLAASPWECWGSQAYPNLRGYKKVGRNKIVQAVAQDGRFRHRISRKRLISLPLNKAYSDLQGYPTQTNLIGVCVVD